VNGFITPGFFHGSLIFGLLAAAVLTPAVSYAVLGRYRISVARGMRSRSGLPESPAPAQAVAVTGNAVRMLEMGLDTSNERQAGSGFARRLDHAVRGARIAYGIAGLSYGLIAAAVWLVFDGQTLEPLRTLVVP
jgi:hypothetical protein